MVNTSNAVVRLESSRKERIRPRIVFSSISHQFLPILHTYASVNAMILRGWIWITRMNPKNLRSKNSPDCFASSISVKEDASESFRRLTSMSLSYVKNKLLLHTVR